MATDPTPDVNAPRTAVGIARRGGVRHVALALAGGFLFCGCAHKATHYAAPDAAPLNARQAEVAKHIAAAQTHLGRAGASLVDAQSKRAQSAASHSREDVLVAEIAPGLAELKMRVTAELRPEVDALCAQVAQLSLAAAETDAVIVTTGAKIADTVRKVTAATSEIGDAKDAQADIAAKLGPAYQSKTAVLAKRANDAEEGWAASSRALVAARTHSLLFRLGSILFVLLLIAGVVLKITGRLVFTAAGVAAKIP